MLAANKHGRGCRLFHIEIEDAHGRTVAVCAPRRLVMGQTAHRVTADQIDRADMVGCPICARYAANLIPKEVR